MSKGRTLWRAPSRVRFWDEKAGKRVEIDLSNPRLAGGEEVLWRYVEHKGLTKKRVAEERVITNYRIFDYDHERGEMTCAVPLMNADLVVTLTIFRSESGAVNLVGVSEDGEPVFDFAPVDVRNFGCIAVVAYGVMNAEFLVEEPAKLKKLIDAVKRARYGEPVYEPLVRVSREGSILTVEPVNPGYPGPVGVRVDLYQPELAWGELSIRRLVESRGEGDGVVFITHCRVFGLSRDRDVEYSIPLVDAEFLVESVEPMRKGRLKSPVMLNHTWLEFYGKLSKDTYFRVGDVAVLSGGSIVARWKNVLDPYGLKNLVDTVKAQLYGSRFE